ncbi:MAG: serine/threonine protein kinase [Gammaproteobacteria bacterium]|nr:serine/threonine protein kinase [Gammaproteobacteria bacterium]
MTPLAAGTELAGRFRLQRLLGRGGSAEVWAATDTTAGAEVALRVLPAQDDAETAALLAGLEADAAQLRRLVHPGILRPLAVVAADHRVCVAVELADGGDLGVLRGAGWQAVVAAIREVADALQYVHAQGLTHGDLKAANVLRDRQGRWRLTDFRSGSLPDATAPVSLSTVSPQQLDGSPPTAADDIYSLGAVLYDLLAGQPPLHPGITPERIRGEVPPRLGVDGTGEAVPRALTQLVAAMLEKSPRLRPGSLGAVRALLADIAAEAVRPPLPPATDGGTEPAWRRPPLRGAAAAPAPRSRWLVAAAFIVVLAAVLAVVFWLPGLVTGRGPLVSASPPAPVVVPAPPAAVVPVEADPRRSADTALAGRLSAEGEAQAAGADRWGGAEWLEARRLAGLGDAQYKARDFAAAAASFDAATTRFRRLAAGAPAAFDAALKSGQKAFDSADQPAAVAAFERALLIRPDDPAAAAGLARSQRLDEILAGMAEAAAREAAGDPGAALASYGAVLKLDAGWPPARAAIARLDAARAAGEFERAMAQGLSALAAGRPAEARTALNRAVALRPGDANARAALAQLDGDERRTRLTALQGEAERLAAAERWAEAADRYRELQQLDATLAAARDGLAAAEARAALHQRLEQQLANGERFNDDAVVAEAQAVLRDAGAVAAPGPVLTGQVNRLRELIAAAATPVPVQFESDNLTRVMIYKVGPLGTFNSRTVELRPGAYVVVGTRDGYRDVRRNVRVTAGSGGTPISVRCEEPI